MKNLKTFFNHDVLLANAYLPRYNQWMFDKAGVRNNCLNTCVTVK